MTFQPETKMFFLALTLAATPAAGAFQSTELLDVLVAQFTGKAIGAEGGARARVDTRLKLAACPAPQLEWRTDAQDAVVVRCMAPEWRLYVPVNMVPRPKSVPTPETARAVPPPKPELVIKRGDAVTLEASAEGFSITREGVAASDAAAGGRVMIRVDERKPPIQAIALEMGRARLPSAAE